MKTYEEKVDAIREILDDMDESDLVDLYNSYGCADSDDRIYPMCDLDRELSSWYPSDIIRELHDLDPDDYWFRLGCEPESAYDAEDLMRMDKYDLAEHALDSDEDYDNEDIRAILDEADSSDLEDTLEARVADIPDDDLIELWNNYAHAHDDPKLIFRQSKADSILSGLNAWDLVRSMHLAGNHVDLGEEFIVLTKNPDNGQRLVSTTDSLAAFRDPAKLVPYLLEDEEIAKAFLAAHNE